MMRLALHRRALAAYDPVPALPVMRGAAWRAAAAASAALPGIRRAQSVHGSAQSMPAASHCSCRCFHSTSTLRHDPPPPPSVHFPAVSLAVGLAAQRAQSNPIRIMAAAEEQPAIATGDSAAAATEVLTRPETASKWERETAALLDSFAHPADRPPLSASWTALHGLDADAKTDPALRNRHTIKAYGRILSIRKQLDELIAARLAQQGDRERLLHERATEVRQIRANRRVTARLGDRATDRDLQALWREERVLEQRLPLGASALDGAQEDERLTRLLSDNGKEDQFEALFAGESAYPSPASAPASEVANTSSHAAAVDALQSSFESALVLLLHCLLWDARAQRNTVHETQETVYKTPWSSASDPLLRRFQLLQPLEALRRFSTECRSSERAGRMASWLWREYICTQIERAEGCLSRQIDAYEQWAQACAATRGGVGKRGRAAAAAIPVHFQKENPHFPLLGPRETTILLRLLNCAPDLEASLQVHQYILRTQRATIQALQRVQHIDVEYGLSGARKLSEVPFESLPVFVSALDAQFESAMMDHYGALIDGCGKTRPWADESRATALFVEYTSRMKEACMIDLFHRDSLLFIQTSLLRVSAAAGDWRRAMYLLKHSIPQPTVIHVSLVLTAVSRAFQRPPMRSRPDRGGDDDFALLAASPAEFAAKDNPRILPLDTIIESPTAKDFAARDEDAMMGARIALRLAATVEARFTHHRDSQGVPFASPRWARFFPDSPYYTLLVNLFGSVGDLNGCLYLMEQLLRGDAPGARNLRVGERFFAQLIHVITNITTQTSRAAEQQALAANQAPVAIGESKPNAELPPPMSSLLLAPADEAPDTAAAAQEEEQDDGSEQQQADVVNALMLVDPLSSSDADSFDADHLSSSDLVGFTSAPLVAVSTTGSLYAPAQLFLMAQRIADVMAKPPFYAKPTEITFQAMLGLHIVAPRFQKLAATAAGAPPAVTLLWEKLLATGVRPSRRSFDRYLRALLAARQYPRALDLMESMCAHRPSMAGPLTICHFLSQSQRHISRILVQQEAEIGAVHRIDASGRSSADYLRVNALTETVAQNRARIKDVLQRLLPIYEHAHTWPSAPAHSAELARLLLACFAAARDHKRCLALFQLMQPRSAGPAKTARRPLARASWPSLRVQDLLSQVSQSTDTCNAALWACVQATHYPDGQSVWSLMHRAPSCANRVSYCLWLQLLVSSMRPLSAIQSAYDTLLRLPALSGSEPADHMTASTLNPLSRGVDRPRLADFNQWIQSAWKCWASAAAATPDPNAATSAGAADQQREALVLWLYRVAQRDFPPYADQFPVRTLQIVWRAAHASEQLGPTHAFTMEVESKVRAQGMEMELDEEARQHAANGRRRDRAARSFGP